jgi:hypothetical protein
VKKFIILLFFYKPVACSCQKPYWQQRVDFAIDVNLNVREKTLDGFETITYTNHAPDTLLYIWFHLWPNAYKNDQTAFSNQILQQGKTGFYFSSKEERGYINRLDFKVNGRTAKTEDHPEHIDVIKLVLPAPLPPAGQITITTPFRVKLPALFSRSGYSGHTFQLTQWYPKPAVYDGKGWHPMPYLEQGEFYSDFGDYTVSITLPEKYIVAATGVLQNRKEPESKKQMKPNLPASSSRTTQKRPHGHLKKFADAKPSILTDTIQKTKTLVYAQEQVHDFAWTASNDYTVESDTCRLPSGKTINVYAYYTHRSQIRWKNCLTYLKAALRFYAAEVGEYPYAAMTLAESGATAAGGMEYPALAIISAPPSEEPFDLLIAHETGHMWFYGALATNEREAPWMDEGLNTFYERKYAERHYGQSAKWEELLLQTSIKQKRDQSITTHAADFTPPNYALVAYYKTARWLAEVEKSLGMQSFQEQMQAYYKQWQNKHPQHENLKKFLAPGLRDTSLWAQIHTRGSLPGKQLSGFSMVSPVVPGTIKRHLQQPTRNLLLASPVLGYNYYDKSNDGCAFFKLQFTAGKPAVSAAASICHYARKNGTASATCSIPFIHPAFSGRSKPVYPAWGFQKV